MEVFDTVIVGAGPAGCAAALHSLRYDTRMRLVSDEPVGGLLGAASRVDNYPGFPSRPPGSSISRILARQLAANGITPYRHRISSITSTGTGFLLTTASGNRFESRTVLLCTGTAPIEWTLPGGIDPDAAPRILRDIRLLPETLDGAPVAIIGSGEAALDSALSAHSRLGCPIVFTRGNRLKASDTLVKRFTQSGIRWVRGLEAQSLRSDSDRMTLESRVDGKLSRDTFRHIVVCIGRSPRWERLRDLGSNAPPRHIETGIDGVFAAGDLITSHERYAGIAIGDGIEAIERARRYLLERNTTA